MNERKNVLTSVDGQVFMIALDRPRVNAIDLQLLSELENAVDAFLNDPSLKAAIITSANHSIFSAGADIARFSELAETGNIKDYILYGQKVYKKISQSSKPMIAAVHGIAMGGAFELVLACHIRILAERAKLGCPEINLGIMPGWGGTQMLPRIVGSAKAIELILLGEAITAQEALRINLANAVVPRGEVLPTAIALAKKLAEKSSLASQAAMEAILAAAQLNLEDGLTYEANRFAALVDSEDAHEGVQAFLEKRQPSYKGR